MIAENLCTDDLRRVPVFKDLAEPQLAWLVEQATCLELAAGDRLWTECDPAEAMYVALSGTIRLHVDLAGQSVQVDSHRWGGVIGLLPYSRMKQHPGNAMASEPSRVLKIPRERFPDVLQTIPELGYLIGGEVAVILLQRALADEQDFVRRTAAEMLDELSSQAPGSSE